MQQASVVAASPVSSSPSPSSPLPTTSTESPTPTLTTSTITAETSCKIGEVNYVLKSFEPNFTIEAIRNGDFHRWASVLVDKKESERITNGYFDSPVLKEIVATAFDNLSHDKEDKGVKAEVNVCSTGDILFVITLKEHFSTRRFEIPLTHQQDDPVVRLEHIIREQAAEIKQLKEQVRVLKIKNDRQVMIGQHPGTISNPQSAVDVANIKLGAGKWAIHYSFFYALSAPHTGGGWIYFDLMYGTASVKDQGNNRGHFVPTFLSSNSTYPYPVSGMAVIDNADSHQEVYLRFTPYTTQPNYSNVVIVAHPVE